MSQSTITLQSVVNYSAIHAELLPIVGVGGFSNEPALSIANDVLCELLGQPFPWKFNRKFPQFFVTQQYKQDYKFAGAVAWTNTGGAAIDLATNNAITQSGAVTTVNTIESHNFAVGATLYQAGCTVSGYNSTVSVTLASGTQWTSVGTITAITSTSYTYTAANSGLGTSGAAGITDLGWLESATMVNLNDTSANPYVWYLQAVRTLEPASWMQTPDRVSVLADDGAGTITFRLRYIPGPQPLAVSVVYQKRPVLLTSLSSTWAPFPDENAYVYRQLFLAAAFRYANSPRADVEYQKAQANIAKALGMNDREQSEEYITPDSPLVNFTNSGWWGWF